MLWSLNGESIKPKLIRNEVDRIIWLRCLDKNEIFWTNKEKNGSKAIRLIVSRLLIIKATTETTEHFLNFNKIII